jgi:hypothetical protein
VFGFFETVVEYYTGRDASQMTDNELALKVAHISRIRQMEAEQTMIEQLNVMLGKNG